MLQVTDGEDTVDIDALLQDNGRILLQVGSQRLEMTHEVFADVVQALGTVALLASAWHKMHPEATDEGDSDDDDGRSGSN